MWQIINLTYPADRLLIDNYTVKFNLSAWIGGLNIQNDEVIVSLKFIDQFNQIISNNVTIGPVLSNDRGGQTASVFRQAHEFVPIGTRYLRIHVNITRDAGTWNNGNIDNIALILYQ
jgi:hypothetical protein